MTSYGPAKTLTKRAGRCAGAFASAPVKLDQLTTRRPRRTFRSSCRGRLPVGRHKLTIYEGIPRRLQHGGVLAQCRFAEANVAPYHQ